MNIQKGKDQLIMNHVAYNLHPMHRLKENASVLVAHEAKCGDEWFFYQRYLASSAQYRDLKGCTKERMSLLDTAGEHL